MKDPDAIGAQGDAGAGEAAAGDDPQQRRESALARLSRTFPALRAFSEAETTRLLVAGVIVGVLAGVAAGAFDKAMTSVGWLVLGQAEPAANAPAFWPALLGPTFCGVLGGAIILFLTKHGRAQGVPHVVARTRLRDQELSGRDGFWGAVAAAIVVGGGHSGGREGPIIQLSATMATKVCKWLGINPSQARVLVAAGGGAGIAASFNTPVGGSFFALEIILGNFAVQSFAPVVAATVCGTVVGQALLGTRIALHLPRFTLMSPLELIFYVILGLISGVVAVLFKRALAAGRERLAHFDVPLPVRTGLAGLAVGAVAASGMYQVMGNGYAYMEVLIGGESGATLGFLAFLFVAKIVATTFTAAGRGGSGIFAPSLFLGAVVGTGLGGIVQHLAPGHVEAAGAYGMVGMGAVAAAVLHAPITMTLMLFEMTGNYQVILPLLLAHAVAGIVSAAMHSDSIYISELEHMGLDLDEAREGLIMYDLRVKDIMRQRDVFTVVKSTPLKTLLELFLAEEIEEVYVVDEGGRYEGMIDLQRVKTLLGHPEASATIPELEGHHVPPAHPDQPLADTLALFFRMAVDEIPVVDEGGRLVGVLAERDVVAAYYSEVLDKDVLLARVEVGPDEDRQTDFVELPPGQAIEIIDVRGPLAGQTLRDLRLPQRFGCTVMAISVHDPELGRWTRHAPNADMLLNDGDRIVVFGPTDKVEALEAHTTTVPPA